MVNVMCQQRRSLRQWSSKMDRDHAVMCPPCDTLSSAEAQCKHALSLTSATLLCDELLTGLLDTLQPGHLFPCSRVNPDAAVEHLLGQANLHRDRHALEHLARVRTQ